MSGAVSHITPATGHFLGRVLRDTGSPGRTEVPDRLGVSRKPILKRAASKARRRRVATRFVDEQQRPDRASAHSQPAKKRELGPTLLHSPGEAGVS